MRSLMSPWTLSGGRYELMSSSHHSTDLPYFRYLLWLIDFAGSRLGMSNVQRSSWCVIIISADFCPLKKLKGHSYSKYDAKKDARPEVKTVCFLERRRILFFFYLSITHVPYEIRCMSVVWKKHLWYKRSTCADGRHWRNARIEVRRGTILLDVQTVRPTIRTWNTPDSEAHHWFSGTLMVLFITSEAEWRPRRSDGLQADRVVFSVDGDIVNMRNIDTCRSQQQTFIEFLKWKRDTTDT